MTYAIIAAGGAQLRVEPGRFYDINRLPVEADEKITLDNVLMVENDGDLSIGQPLVEGATVSGTVISHLRGKKVIVYKMQPKKKTRKKRGHRQELTRVMIDSITVGGKTIAAGAEAKTDTAKADKAAAPAKKAAAKADNVEVAEES
jgi:large subunit ribosomal protein L21